MSNDEIVMGVGRLEGSVVSAWRACVCIYWDGAYGSEKSWKRRDEIHTRRHFLAGRILGVRRWSLA